MSKAKRRRVTIKAAPWNGDHGTGTAAAQAGTVLEEIKDNPNRMARRKRVNVIDGYYKSGIATKRQASNAQALLCAFEATQRTAPAIKAVQVDSSPKPDHAIDMMVDRIAKYHSLAKHVPDFARAEISHAVVENIAFESPSKGYGYCLEKMSKLLLGLDKFEESFYA